MYQVCGYRSIIKTHHRGNENMMSDEAGSKNVREKDTCREKNNNIYDQKASLFPVSLFIIMSSKSEWALKQKWQSMFEGIGQSAIQCGKVHLCEVL